MKDSLNFYLYCESEINEYSKDVKYHNYLLRELNFDIKLILNEKYEDNKEPLINVAIDIPNILIQNLIIIENINENNITFINNELYIKI